MTLTLDSKTVSFSNELVEYLDLMRTALVPPGEPPLTDKADVILRIIQNTFLANIQTTPSVRPASVAARMKQIESEAGQFLTSVAEASVSSEIMP